MVAAIVAVTLLLSFSWSSRALAAPLLRIDPSTKHVELAQYLDVFDDPTGRLDLADVTTPEIAARFRAFEGRVGPNENYTASTLWARFAIENTSDVPLERWLVLDAAFLEHVEVFRDGEPPAVQGILHPRSQRELPRRTFSFRIALAPHQVRVVHARTWGLAEVMLPMQLWEVGALSEADRGTATFAALGLGVMLAMALYNAFLSFFVRDASHLLYAGYMVFIGAWCMCIDGSLLDALPGSVQTLPHWVNVVSVYGGFILAGLFVRSVLGLRAARPQMDRLVLAVVVALFVIATSYLVGVLDYRQENIVARPLVIGDALLLIAAAAVRWRDGLTSAAYVLFAWIALFAITMYVQLAYSGVIPVLPPPVSFGYAVEAILLSLALANAMRERAVQVEERGREVTLLNEELRHQVAERSRELTEALARSEGTVSPAALEVGDLFDGRYRVKRQLGRGGMGAVYEVERARDDRRLALKVITAALSSKSAARFAREAEIGARLTHTNLVSIVDVGIAAGVTPFLVMELVRGGSMEDQRSRFGDAAWALPILAQVARGLGELHANRIVHRDLKPGNVLLVEGGPGNAPVAKIADFGISRFGGVDDCSEGKPNVSPHDLTETGALLGTPIYMPPEAWFGPAQHASADIFSFGVLAYEALTGRSPFDVPAVLLVRSRKPVPVPPPPEGVREEIATLVVACLQQDPEKRPTARRLAESL